MSEIRLTFRCPACGAADPLCGCAPAHRVMSVLATETRRLRADNARLRAAAEAVLADHNKRVRFYGTRETQTARVKVMSDLRAALAPRKERP